VVAYQPVARLAPSPAPRAEPASEASVSAPSRGETALAPVAWKPVIGVKAGDRPLVVWIANAAADAAVEHRTFDDASVRLASRAFRTVRITPDAAKTDPVLAPYAASAPAMVVFSPDLTRAGATSGTSLDARAALDVMRRSARTDLDLDLDGAVAKARALAADEEALLAERARLGRDVPDDSERATELDRRLATVRADLVAALRPTRASTH
jgi:hypothetical protein